MGAVASPLKALWNGAQASADKATVPEVDIRVAIPVAIEAGSGKARRHRYLTSGRGGLVEIG